MFEFILPENYHLWGVLAIIGLAIYLYASERLSMEMTSLVVIAVLLLFFKIFPYFDIDGDKLTIEELLMGFANPALIAVICLLVLGQTMVQTGALDKISGIIMAITRGNGFFAVMLSLIFVAVVSAFMNNTPVVVIFIPIMISLARNLDLSVSKVMIPLSYASILGGMITLIGSSTNLLVSGVLHDLGFKELNFFDFTLPGLVLAGVGLVYIMLILPKMIPDRASFIQNYQDNEIKNREFIAQLEIDSGSSLLGQSLASGALDKNGDIVVKMIQRGEHMFLPPFDEAFIIKRGDTIITTSNKDELVAFLSSKQCALEKHFARISEDGEQQDGELEADIQLAEIVVTPTSNLVGMSLEQSHFSTKNGVIVLGIQRQARQIRSKMSTKKLNAGDVLLVMGSKESISRLQRNKEFLLLEWLSQDITNRKSLTATTIFISSIALAAFGVLPIAVSAILGVIMVLATKSITMPQALRAIDLKIYLMIPASLAMGVAMHETGGASFIANHIIDLFAGSSPLIVMSALFVLMIVMTNILSNNATAVLFTPIAVNLALQLGVNPMMFVFAVIFGCNCSFITPIGYQTNLMVMGPGHYKFGDFVRSGIPLAIVLWLTYSALAYFMYL